AGERLAGGDGRNRERVVLGGGTGRSALRGRGRGARRGRRACGDRGWRGDRGRRRRGRCSAAARAGRGNDGDDRQEGEGSSASNHGRNLLVRLSGTSPSAGYVDPCPAGSRVVCPSLRWTARSTMSPWPVASSPSRSPSSSPDRPKTCSTSPRTTPAGPS